MLSLHRDSNSRLLRLTGFTPGIPSLQPVSQHYMTVFALQLDNLQPGCCCFVICSFRLTPFRSLSFSVCFALLCLGLGAGAVLPSRAGALPHPSFGMDGLGLYRTVCPPLSPSLSVSRSLSLSLSPSFFRQGWGGGLPSHRTLVHPTVAGATRYCKKSRTKAWITAKSKSAQAQPNV